MKPLHILLVWCLPLLSTAQQTNEIQKIPATISDPNNIYGLVYYPDVVTASANYMAATYTGLSSDSLDSVTIYKKINQVWELDTVLFSPGSPARYGEAACMNDEFLFVSATEDNTLGEQVGSVFIYQRTGNTWQLSQNIFPSFVDEQTHFGNQLALSGEFLFARNIKGPDSYSSVEVFHLENGIWSYQQSFTGMRASRIDANEELVIIQGALINEAFDPEPQFFTCTLQDFNWAVTDTMASAYSASSDYPDISISNSNKMAVEKDDGPMINFYFYHWQNAQWQLEDTLSIMTNNGMSTFQYNNDYLFLGYDNTNHVGLYSGFAEAYKRAQGSWISLGEIAPSDHGAWDEFGRTMAISDDQLLLGSYDLQGSVYLGAVYAFQISGCADPNACNYTPGITSALDALCTYPGCTIEGACNYDPLACEGGACVFGEEGDLDCSGSPDINDLILLLAQFGCTSDCEPFDLDGDGVVGMSDLMMMIGLVE